MAPGHVPRVCLACALHRVLLLAPSHLVTTTTSMVPSCQIPPLLPYYHQREKLEIMPLKLTVWCLEPTSCTYVQFLPLTKIIATIITTTTTITCQAEGSELSHQWSADTEDNISHTTTATILILALGLWNIRINVSAVAWWQVHKDLSVL